jgi:hypothetical protein
MTAVLGAVVIAATGICLAALIRAHLVQTGYRPIRNAVSDFGVGRAHVWYWTAASSIGIAALALAAALARGVDPAPTTVIALLVAFALARFAITAFPTDLDRSRLTGIGRIHILLAGIAFASIAIAAGKLPDAVRTNSELSSHHAVLAALGWAVIATSIATGVAISRLGRALDPWFGLIERLFYAAMLTWFFVIGYYLVA